MRKRARLGAGDDNDARAEEAAMALDAYSRSKNGQACGTLACGDEETIIDLLADLLHFCRREDYDFDKLLRQARDGFNVEVVEEEGESAITPPPENDIVVIVEGGVAYVYARDAATRARILDLDNARDRDFDGDGEAIFAQAESVTNGKEYHGIC